MSWENEPSQSYDLDKLKAEYDVRFGKAEENVEEPIHVTFARVVMGCVPLYVGKCKNWYCLGDCPTMSHQQASDWGDATLRRYDLDRAFCQELAEANLLLFVYGWHGLKWRVKHDYRSGWEDECTYPEPMPWCDTQCEAVLRWAIAAKQAGVPVRLPGGER